MTFPVDVKYEKNVVEHVLRIETDEFEICKTKIVKKRKWLVCQEVFAIHVFPEGRITWRKLK
jgi:hypothetical protein